LFGGTVSKVALLAKAKRFLLFLRSSINVRHGWTDFPYEIPIFVWQLAPKAPGNQLIVKIDSGSPDELN
jgi:hypothetical protein